jgi:hypothetical protein
MDHRKQVSRTTLLASHLFYESEDASAFVLLATDSEKLIDVSSRIHVLAA